MSRALNLRRWVISSLVASIIGAVAATGWLLWPAWQEFRERTEWERKACELRIAASALKWPATKRPRDDFSFTDGQGNSVGLLTYYWSTYWYCIYIKTSSPFSSTISELRIYRLESPHEQYQPQTDAARQAVMRVGQVATRSTPAGPIEEPALPLEGEVARRAGFITDFFQIIAGQTDGNLGIRYELIHADPR